MFLKEGGAGGHMQHPFDLADVKTGKDLKDFFDQAAEVVKKSQAVKIDGVNVSFKLISDKKGRKEFAVDRGSTKPIDIEGISIDRVGERFPEGHGMRPAIKTLLSIFNEALPKIEPELKKLGMWDNPTIFLNTEYVSETTNVTEYDHSFLAIHGVNQFYEKTNSRTGIQRPGLIRPEGLKDPSVEVSYDSKVLQRLADKVQPFAKKYDFEVYTTVPTSFKKEAEINFKNTLDQPFTVVFDGEDEITQSLGDWLEEVDNPRHIFIKKENGKKIGALSKEVYTTILNGTPITSLIPNEEDVKPAIAGAVFYHATRMLGNDILNALTSPMGDVMNHEGVVIRHKKFGQKPVKITGEFILGGMRTSFQESKEYSEDFINEVLDVFLEELGQKEKTIVLYPGRFQPMGKHHLSVFRELEEKWGRGNVYIITSDKVNLPKSPLNFEEKKQIMIKHGIPEEQILFAKSPYRGKELDNYFDPENTVAIYAVGKKDMDEDPRFANLDGVTKGGNFAWYKDYERNKDDLEVYNKHGYVMVSPHVSMEIDGFGEMCGSTIRACLQNLTPEVFEKLMGWSDEGIYNMVRDKIAQPPENISEMIFEIIKEVYSERQRGWACSQIDDPDELTKSQAEEMCSSKIKEEEELEELKTGTGDSGFYSNTPGPPRADCKQCCKQCNCPPKPRPRSRASFNSDEDPFDPIEEISGAGAAGGYSLPLGQKPKRFNSPRPKVKGIKIYTRRSKGN